MKRWWILVLLALGLYLADSRGFLGWLLPLRRAVFQAKHPVQINLADAEKAVNDAEVIKLKGENEYLRKLLGAKLPANWQLQPAQVIKADKDGITVASGAKEGVKPGMIILALDKIAVAKVTQVNPVQSEAEFITEARVKTESGALGKLKRQNQLLTISEVRQEYKLKPGELVMTAGKDGWPPDLPVGRIGQVEKIDTGVYQSAVVEPVISYPDLSEVAILLEPFFN